MPTITGILAGVSVGLSAAGSTMSFAQAAQAGKAARAARADAEKFVTKAREQLSRNAYAALSLPMQQYEMQREELARMAGQTTEAFRTAERGAPAAATAAIMAADQSARNIGAQAAQQMYGLESLQAGEQARLDAKLANLELEMASGAAQAYRDEMNARNAALTQGFQQAGQALATGLSTVEDYDPTKSVIDTSGDGGVAGKPIQPGTQQIAGFDVPAFQYPGAIDRMGLATQGPQSPATMIPLPAQANMNYLRYDPIYGMTAVTTPEIALPAYQFPGVTNPRRF